MNNNFMIKWVSSGHFENVDYGENMLCKELLQKLLDSTFDKYNTINYLDISQVLLGQYCEKM